MRDRIRKLLLGKRFGVLATRGADYPCASLLAYFTTDDLREIYFVTHRNTAKYRNIKEDPNVSFLVFELGKNPAEEGESVTAIGHAVEIKNRQALDKFLVIHPGFENFTADSDCSLMKIIVKRYMLVNNIRDVEICDI